MTELTNRALLVSLQISQWAARKMDRKETAELALKHGTMSEVARVNKSLLPMAAALDAIHKKTGQIRWLYYDNSLPWGQEGINVISTSGYMEFVAMMSEAMNEWRALVKDFLAVYPQLREDARLVLNGMYREEDYPSPSELARKFSIDVRFMPVPAEGDWRVELADDEIERLRAKTVEDLRESQHVAMRDVWKRVHEVVEHAVSKLSGDPKYLRESLVANALQMCKTMTILNIAQDPDLERIRHDIEGALAGHTSEGLRADPVARVVTVTKMQDIMAKMGGLYTATS